MDVWVLALGRVVVLAIYGAGQTLKTWFYRRLGPQWFAGRDSVYSRKQRGALVWTAVLIVVMPALVWGWLNELRELRSLELTTGVVHEMDVAQTTCLRSA